MSDFTEKQKKNLAYFKAHLDEFLSDELLKDKHVIIVDGKIQKSFDTIESAIDYAVEHFEYGDYIIQQIIDESEAVGFIMAAVM